MEDSQEKDYSFLGNDKFKSSTSSANARTVVDAFLGRAKTLLNVNSAEPCEATNVQRA